MNSFFRYVFFAGALFLFACRKEVGKVNYGDYPADIGLIIHNKCATAGCHNSKSYQAANGYNLETWISMFSGSNNGSPVIPYNSEFSPLCNYINTYSDLGIRNTPTMPLNNAALSRDEVTRIKSWIDGGAPDVNGKVMWADNLKRKKLYAVNQGCDMVTVFDSETQLPMRYIKVGNKPKSTPHALRVSPDGQYWYVVFINNNIMQKFRCSDDSYVGDIPLGNSGNWNAFVITKDSKKAYCSALQSNGVVAAVDLENLKLLHYLPGISNAHGIALNAAEDMLYVSTQYGNYITQLDTGFSQKNEISLEPGISPSTNETLNPHFIFLASNKKELLISCQKKNEVRVLDISTNAITAIIPTGTFPQEIVYSSNSNYYFITCTDDTLISPYAHGSVTRINSNNYTDTKQIACGYQPHGIAVDEERKLIYVLSRNVSGSGPLPHHTSQCGGKNGFVNFIDLNSFKLLSKTYELSVDPYYIFARP